MAGTKALNVRMNFQVDTTQARQQIQQLGAQLNSIGKNTILGVNSSLGITSQILEATKAAGQLKNALAEAINPLTGNLNLSAFNDQLIASGMKLSDYRTQLSALGTAGNQAFNSLTRSIMTAETPLLRTGKAAQQMWTVLGNTVRWQATSSMIHGIMSTASQAMNYVKSLDSSLNNIRIVTGQNQAQMERFAQTANKAAKQLNTSTNEYAKASLIYYQQGLSNKEVEARTATTIKLANVAGESAAKVSDQLTAVWNNFYDGSKSLEYYADVMTALGASTASSTDEIAKGLEKFSSIAKTTGLSYEYATSALSTVVAATRQSADSVGTSFKTLFSRLQGLSLGETLDDGTTLNKYSKALDVIGVNIKNANGSLKDMDRILDEIGDKWTSLSKAEQVALAQTVGGARNYTGLVSLMDNWDDFQVNLKTAQQAQGTLQNQADIYAQSWEAASKHVRAASETIYKNLLDDKFFKGMTNMFGYFLDGIGEVTNQMGGFKGVMSGLANFAFTTFAPQISKGFANIGSSIYGITPWGQEKVLDLRKQAMNAVTSNIRLSQYDNVNRMAHGFNEAFVDRQVAFDNAVQQGRISEYQQPIYQNLIGQLGQESDRIIAQAEQNALMANTRRMTNGQLLTGIQTGITERYNQLKQEFTGISQERLNKIIQTTAGAERYRAFLNMSNTIPSQRFNAQSLEPYIKSYNIAISRENIAKDFIPFYTKTQGTYGLSTIDDMRQTADKLYGLAEAAKTSNIALDEVIPGLGAFHTQLTGMNKDIGQLTDGELTALFSNSKVNQTLGKIIQRLEGDSVSEAVKTNMEKEIRQQLGLQDGQKSNVVDKAMNILSNNKLTAEERAAQLSQMGINLFQSKTLTGQMKGETIPQTMAMSSALATNMGALASLGQVVNSVSTAFKTFSDENATAGQQIASLTSLAMSGSMAIKPFGNFIKTAGEQVTVFGKSLGITNGALGGIMLGLAATGMAVKTYINEQKKVSIAGQIETLNTSIATSQQLTADATAAYETLLSGETTHNNLISKINTLKKGTSDFTAALLEANETANNLIETGSLVYGEDYFYDQNGLINFQPDALRRAEENALELRKERLAGQNQLQIARNTLQYYHSYISDLSSIGGYQTYNLPYIQQALTALGKDKNSLKNVGVGDLLTAILKEAGDKGVEQFTTNNIDILQAGLNNVLPKLGKFDLSNEDFQNNLMNMTMTSSVEDAYSKLADAANYLKSQGINGGWFTNQQFEDLTPENQFFIASLFNPDAMKQVQLNGQNSIDSVLSNMELSDSTRDLVNFAISSNPDFAKNMLSLYSTATLAGTQSLGEGVLYGESPRDWYQQLYGKMADANYTDEQVDALVQQKLIQDILLNGTDKYTNLKQLENFTTINDALQKVQELNLPNLENLNYQQITTEFNKLLDHNYEEWKPGHLKDIGIADTDKNKAIQEYRDYAKQIYENQWDDLATAMLRGMGDGLLDGAAKTEDDSIFGKRINALTKPITVNGKEVMSSLTYGALKQATNAMINANEVGESTANTMYSLLLRGRTQNGGFDANTLAAIQNYNLDNTIASIYSNNNLKRYAANQAQRDKYIELFSSQIEDIGKEKGWFQMLYNSSGFSDVLDKINSQFQSTGQITAQYITDLAGKSEELSQFLKVSSDNAELLSVNAGGLAAIFEEMNRGTSGLTSTNISSDFISAISRAESRSAANASAFEVVDNLDLGRSGLDFLDYFQDMGKEMYQANKAGWGFYSDPIQNIIDKIGGSKVREAYMEANANPDWNFQQMWNFMKTDKRSAGFMTFMEAMAGKKGKGGGGPADVMKYLYDTLGGAGFTDKDWNKLGFKVGQNGEFFLADNKTFTQEQLTKNLTNLLMTDYGWTEEDANNYAQVIMSTASTSGQIGQTLDQRGAQAGFKDLLNGPITQEEYDTYFRRYGALMGFIDDNEKTGREKFEEAFKAGGGSIGLNLQRDEWQGVTSLKDLAERSNKQGVTYTQNGETYTIGGTGSTTMDILQLANAYGAAVVGENGQLTGQLDYNKLVTMIETMGGTEEDLIKMLENDQDTVQKLVAKTASGEDISWTGKGTVRDWVKDVHAVQGDTVFKYSELSQEAANMAQMYENMVMSQDENGNWTWHYETIEDRQRREEKEKEDQRIATRDQKLDLFHNYGLSIREINSRLENGETLTDIKADLDQRNDLKDQGYSDEEINKIIQAQQSNHLSLDDAKAFVNSGWETVAAWEKNGKTTNPNKQQPSEEQLSEPETTTEPVSEYYEPDDIPIAPWEMVPDAGKNKELAEKLGYGKEPVVPEGSPYSDGEIAKQQTEATQRTIDLLMQSGYSQALANQIVNREITPEEAQAAKEAEAAQMEEETEAIANAVGDATETAVTTTAETQNILAEKIDENLTAMGEAIPGSEEYNKAFATASQYTPSNTAAEKTNDLLTDQLRQEKFIAENTQLTAESTTAQLDYLGEEEEAAQTRKAIGQEKGQNLDKEGKSIELPQNQQQSRRGTEGRDSWTGGREGNTSNSSGMDATTGADMRGTPAMSLFNQILADGGGAADLLDAGFTPAAVAEYYDSVKKVAAATGGKASGQNNTRLLAYASGKEGHIAVTGELGPELRVKSDGSMDILGKTGREYAWVEPDDRIYTAAQSAGILKSNKIPGLEGLAKGIHNFIPGYDSGWIGADWNNAGSGGGSSGGGGSRGGGAPGEKDPRYDPNTLKIRDILERYYTILQQVDDITKAVEHIGKAIDRGWGQERIKNLERQEKLLESQYKMQEAYVKEIKDYLEVDKNALTTMVTDFVKEYNEGKNDADKINLAGALFDENGVLTNYKDIVQKLVDKYNENAEANAQNKEEQYKFQERLKDIQMYTDTLNQLQEAEEKLYDLNNQILDTRIRQITYRIEYENEMDANDLKLINFQYDQIADNAYRSAEAIDLVAQKSGKVVDQINRYENGFIEILGQYFDQDLTDRLVKMFRENPSEFAKEWQKIMETDPRYQDITDEHKGILENYMDGIIDGVKTLWDNYDKTIATLGDDIKTFGKTLDGIKSKFDYFNSVYDSLNNIIGLTNRSLTNIDATFMKTLSDKQLENNMNKFRSASREVQTMNKALEEATSIYNAALKEQMDYTGNDQYTKKELQDQVDNAKKALDLAIEQNENATKQFYDAWEACLKAVEERYKIAMQEVGRDFEKSISPYFMTLELLQNQYDREKELKDLYVRDYQRIHDLSKLNRDIQNSIDDTDNLKGKQRLRDLQEEINDLQENGNDLSEYDLDILQKKYDLELARQALEDAKDAKSMVRLSRDNNGNWSYVYTSNQDDIDEAEQNYEDKIRDMEQANEDYIIQMQDQIVNLTAQARQALEGLNPADFASPEEFQQYLDNLIKYYQDRLDFATSQLNNATGNNAALAPDIQKMYENLNHNLTTNPGQTILSAMFGTQNLDDAVNNIVDGISNMAGEAFKTYATVYSEMQKEVYGIAGVDIANAASSLGDIIETIATASTKQVEVMDKEATRIDDAYSNTIDAIADYQTSLMGLIEETNEATASLAGMNTFLHSSGESIQPDDDPGWHRNDVAGYSSGGYTGRWQYADTGMYTGEWPDGSSRRNGRLAWLHQKELVLNAHDTENFLDAMQIVRQLDNLTNWMANGLGDLMMPRVSSTEGELNQNVHIEAEFPNVTDHNEIEQAFGNLVNMASQYANRK